MSVEVESLSKRFGEVVAVDGLSFQVKPGEVLGFLGPNGAGKSTTMKMITGFLRPTAGRITVNGFDVRKQAIEARRCIGYLPEGAPCYADMSVRDFLFFVAAVRDLQRAEAKQAVADSVDKLGLGPVIDRRIRHLSKGFKRRVGLAQAILHDPQVLILDEPTDGLDPNQKHQVRELIGELSRNKILIISTHILEEVSAVCSRAMIIAEGRLLVDETPAMLLLRSRRHNAVRLALKEAFEARDMLVAIDGVDEAIKENDGRSWLLLPKDGRSITQAVQERVVDLKLPLDNLYVEAGDLDDVFRDITRGSLS